MRFASLHAATFVARPNRFLVHARLGERLVSAACRDPGRLEALLVPGAELRLRAALNPARRTRFDVLLARAGRTWVSVVPALANDVFAAALARRDVPGLRGARVLAREVTRGHSRFDFLLSWRGRQVWTEVKSVGLVERGLALFPDAPTTRGSRHLRELLELVRGGEAAQVIFLVQRGDADYVSPFRARDPDFAQALGEAARGGVRLRAYGCDVGPGGIRLTVPLRVR